MNESQNSPAKLFVAGYKVNEDQTITLGMTEQQFLDWLTNIKKDQVALADIRADMKFVKANVEKLMIQLNLLNEDGTKNKKFRISSLFAVFGILTNEKRRVESFGWLDHVFPIIEKYTDL